MTTHNAKIAAILATNEQRSDNSLRGKSLQRALHGDLPKTLTAYEWEQWYAEHGVPSSHINISEPQGRKPWWRWW